MEHPILIVDDEVEMRIAMSETLKHCGYPVEISHNAIDALNKLSIPAGVYIAFKVRT